MTAASAGSFLVPYYDRNKQQTMVQTRGVQCATSGCTLFRSSINRFCSQHADAGLLVKQEDTEAAAFLNFVGADYSFYTDAEVRTIAHAIQVAGAEETPLHIQFELMDLRAVIIGLGSKTQFLTVEQETLLIEKVNANVSISTSQKYHFDSAITRRTFVPWKLVGISRYGSCSIIPTSHVALQRRWIQLTK
jgi:hypothetical protein